MNYIDIIQDLMIEKNFSQTELASLLNITQTAVTKWLRGERKPSFDNILMFYEKLGIEPNELFGIE